MSRMPKYRFDELQIIRLMAISNHLQALLRPSSHRQVIDYIFNVEEERNVNRFFYWADSLINSDLEECYLPPTKRARTREIIESEELGIFRNRKRAFKIRVAFIRKKPLHRWIEELRNDRPNRNR